MSYTGSILWPDAPHPLGVGALSTDDEQDLIYARLLEERRPLALLLSQDFIDQFVSPSDEVIAFFARPEVLSVLYNAAFRGVFEEEMTDAQKAHLTSVFPVVFRRFIACTDMRRALLALPAFRECIRNGLKQCNTDVLVHGHSLQMAEPKLAILFEVFGQLTRSAPHELLAIFANDKFTPLTESLYYDGFVGAYQTVGDTDGPISAFVEALLARLLFILQASGDIPFGTVSNICECILTLLEKRISRDPVVEYREHIKAITRQLGRLLWSGSGFLFYLRDVYDVIFTYASIRLSTEYVEGVLDTSSLSTSESSTPRHNLSALGELKQVLASFFELQTSLSRGAELSSTQAHFSLLFVLRLYGCLADLKEAAIMQRVDRLYADEYNTGCLGYTDVVPAITRQRGSPGYTAYSGLGGISEWETFVGAKSNVFYRVIFEDASQLITDEVLHLVNLCSTERFMWCTQIQYFLTRIRNSVLELASYNERLYSTFLNETGLLERVTYHVRQHSRRPPPSKRPIEIAFLACALHCALDVLAGVNSKAAYNYRCELFDLEMATSISDHKPVSRLDELPERAQSHPLYSLLCSSPYCCQFLDVFDTFSAMDPLDRSNYVFPIPFAKETSYSSFIGGRAMRPAHWVDSLTDIPKGL
ncbi:hypothetical protein GMRT_13932 [Giardia muris]|uniref:Uncharacterized protein n=1 Tax=Giardia muris TaxID=5742 RepID=A0A4Z1SLG3_GIAMU|nr:hypothetical protein GMRT_13932 [Giardia muris]|eukprot:TNJ26484.1 hypothetical protein GMRT_13932 [Giardia muris]